MTEDERQIRNLIDRWAEAVHSGDMAGVLADHSDDIVMFDRHRHMRVLAESMRIARRGRRSSNGSRRVPASRWWPWM